MNFEINFIEKHVSVTQPIKDGSIFCYKTFDSLSILEIFIRATFGAVNADSRKYYFPQS